MVVDQEKNVQVEDQRSINGTDNAKDAAGMHVGPPSKLPRQGNNWILERQDEGLRCTIGMISVLGLANINVLLYCTTPTSKITFRTNITGDHHSKRSLKSISY